MVKAVMPNETSNNYYFFKVNIPVNYKIYLFIISDSNVSALKFSSFRHCRLQKFHHHSNKVTF